MFNSINYSELLYLPEFSLSIFIFLILTFFTILEYYYRTDILNKWCGFLSILAILQILYFLINVFSRLSIKGSFLYFQYGLDDFLIFFKIIILIITLICILFAITYSLKEKMIRWEYYILILFSSVGNMLLISSFDLVGIYLGIEIQSLCFYILASFKTRNNFSTEAGVKYFIQGAVASSIFLLGASIVYFAVGTTHIYSIYLITSQLANLSLFNYSYVLFLGVLFIIISLLMKLAVVPFHMWAPDVYEGVPTPVTFIFAILPKIGFIILLIHIHVYFSQNYYHSLVLFFCAILSIIIGILAALYQTKIKRWFAFASIVHISYIILAITIPNIISLDILLFYFIIYMIISISTFLIILMLRKHNNNQKIKTIDELIIIIESNKYLGLAFVFILFSIIGIPPLIGFFSKYFLFYLLISENLYVLSIILIVLNVISGLYYLRLIKKMFFKPRVNNVKGFLTKLNHVDSLFISFFLFINIFACIYIEEIFYLILK